ncbi:response regulator [Chamaesiphon minutus]|uniref:Response regulator containing a CheY-like receiver domain and an HTH DNA-binding domain n=1 Tax=Chamaesiphon minutus (strain ATCC 27169 / PCC 6605) TaxID=1173020 RepID=K9UGC8_CHAP6|nr:response regulator transcription factor [Chamaesiphon minutus]AFY94172.1 response regulator containing a CheY-like receiver domain and an HTH DNA-binding domain [Chamaesiphon minutus PCC 6605]
MIRLVLVDDQNLIRRGLRALLKTDPELEIVGEAENGLEAISLLEGFANDAVENLPPDLVLMDIRMPVMDGVVATREICQRFPDTKVLVLTTFDDREYVSQALQAGASGYLLKDTPFEELTQAIRLVRKGHTQIGPGLAHQVLAQPAPKKALVVSTGWEQLTPREREIICLIAQGASNREIADALFIAEKTVKNRITNILSQLNLRDRTQLAIVALQRGMDDFS